MAPDSLDHHDAPSRPSTERLRLSLYYAAAFTVVGINLPFWPVWLESRGLSAAEIGTVLAVALWARIVVNSIAAHIVDRTGFRRGVMVVLAAASLCLYALFPLAEGFWSLCALSALSGGLFAAITPLGDNLSMLIAYARGFDYGRIRLWGSLGFIAAAVVGGSLLKLHPPSIILWAMLFGVAATLATCATLPAAPTRGAGGRSAHAYRWLLSQRLFWLFLGTTSLINASHAVYYGFATLHWRQAGLGSDTIGLLWGEAVVAEVILFAFSGSVVARVGPAGLLLLGAVGSTVRWLVLGTTTWLPALAVEQTLHALTFGATHLGAMHFIARAVPFGVSARAQALYSSVSMGAVFGLAMLASGRLYESWQGEAFLVCAGLAAAGCLAAHALRRRWDGARLAP
ncbi:MAG: 3-phenylpropionate MFS transporter [Alphaproteobacteria bacterium]